MAKTTQNLALMALMLAAATLGHTQRPTEHLADKWPAIALQTMVPTAFADWREEDQNYAMIVDPGQQQLLDKIYSQTLNRTYVNRSGDRVMLSIAYGKDQSDALQLHEPEACYPAVGFQLRNRQTGALAPTGGTFSTIPVVRVEAVQGYRFEPVTYWTVIGEHTYHGMLTKKIAEMGYGLRGKIPDGMLVRISSIDKQTEHAYQVQASFAQDMLEAIPADFQARFAGVGAARHDGI